MFVYLRRLIIHLANIAPIICPANIAKEKGTVSLSTNGSGKFKTDKANMLEQITPIS